jgi:predicted RecA/RadA family phage recombinase
MRNYVQPGDSLALAVPYAAGVTSGQGVLVGALFGVAAVDGVQNAVIECQTKGVFDITKQPALAITAGARLFWDDTNRRLTTTAILWRLHDFELQCAFADVAQARATQIAARR